MSKPKPCKWKEGDLATYMRDPLYGGPTPVVIVAVRSVDVGEGCDRETRVTVIVAWCAGGNRPRPYMDTIDFEDQHHLLVKRKRTKDAPT